MALMVRMHCPKQLVDQLHRPFTTLFTAHTGVLEPTLEKIDNVVGNDRTIVDEIFFVKPNRRVWLGQGQVIEFLKVNKEQ